MITKGEIVKASLDMLAENGTLASASPDTTDKFLRFLEMMVSSWTNKGLSIGFKQSEDMMCPDATDESGIVIDDLSAVASNLAVFGCSSIGRTPPHELKNIAHDAYIALFVANPIQRVSNPYMPNGTGCSNGAWTPAYQSGEDYIDVENNGQLGDLTE
tara:strand:+ start:4100 stop:4573 length:474 start_codon:yes stop_codon:yes gene_type:complete